MKKLNLERKLKKIKITKINLHYHSLETDFAIWVYKFRISGFKKLILRYLSNRNGPIVFVNYNYDLPQVDFLLILTGQVKVKLSSQN